jgi:hypothetical protein
MSSSQVTTQHTQVARWDDNLRESIARNNIALATALDLVARGKKSKNSSFDSHMFIARYRYGQSVIKPPGAAGIGSQLQAPCMDCNACGQMAAECSGSLPIGIVLRKCVEVYKDADLPNENNSGGFRIPLRMLYEGQGFGVFEFLDSFWSNGVRSVVTPVWRVSSGARSVFVSIPLQNAELTERLKGLFPSSSICRFIPKAYHHNSKRLAAYLQHDPFEWIRLLEIAAVVAKEKVEPWQAEVLIIPQRWLMQHMRTNGEVAGPAKDLLVELYRTGWEQSRNLRNHNIQQAQITHLLGGEPEVSYFARTIQHLIAIQCGDLPGFIPFNSALEAGPFQVVHDLLRSRKLNGVPGLKGRFPIILQPAHIGAHSGPSSSRFAYYSLTLPTLVGPTCSYCPEILKELTDKLHEINEKDVSLLPDGSWQIVDSQSLLETAALHADFLEQFQAAKENWKLTPADFYAPVRQGFLAKFIRLANVEALAGSQGAVA